MKCQYCGVEETFPFRCSYCNRYLCAEHRLPENHECPEIWKATAPREAAPRVTVESKTPYEYKITFDPHRVARTFWFSPTEIKHLTISALLVMAVGLSIAHFYFGGEFFTGRVEILIVSSLIFVLCFVSHEIAHKLTAQRYGLWAEFRLMLFGAILTLISIIPFSPFKIISPGAVMIAGAADQNIIGRTAIAGPATNLVLALISFVPYGFLSSPFAEIALLSVVFNAWIALFNLFPIGVLDGWKVFLWNRIIWALIFIPSLILAISAFLVL